MRNKNIIEVLDRMISSEDFSLPITSKDQLLLFLRDWEEEVLVQYSGSPYGRDWSNYPLEEEKEIIWENKQEVFGKEAIKYLYDNHLLDQDKIYELSLLFYKDVLYSSITFKYVLDHLKTVYVDIPLVILFRLAKLLQKHFEDSVQKFNPRGKVTVVAWA